MCANKFKWKDIFLMIVLFLLTESANNGFFNLYFMFIVNNYNYNIEIKIIDLMEAKI